MQRAPVSLIPLISRLIFGFLLGLYFMLPAAAQNQLAPPSFDIVRVGPDGFAVMAGRGPADAEITIYDSGKFISKSRSNGQGEWAIITETPLAVGDRKLSLRAKLATGKTLVSDEILVVAVPKRGGAGAGGATMALLLSKRPGGISRLLQKPEPEKGLSQVELGLHQLSYSKKSPLSLQGSGRPGALIRIYVDNVHIGDAKAGENGAWRHKARKLQPGSSSTGVRRLRLDQIDAGGKVDARIEVNFGNEEEKTAVTPAAKKSSKTAKKKTPGKKMASAKEPSTDRPAAKKAGDKGDNRDGFVVQRGQNLWRIAQKIYGEGTKYTVIFRANKGNIRDPNKIYPGQVLKLGNYILD